MNISKWSTSYLKSSISSYRKPSQLYRLNDRRFFYKSSNVHIQTNILERSSHGVGTTRFCNNVRRISTTSRLSSERSGESIIRLIAESDFVYSIQGILVKFHDFTGLSWWATIIVAAFTVRTVFVLPLAIHQHYIAAKLEEVQKTLDTTVKTDVTKMVNELSEKRNWDSKRMSQEYKQIMRQRRHDLILENNCHPAKTAVIVVMQAPVWICLSSALRNLVHMLPMQDTKAQVIYLQLKVSNILWLSDLTIPDPTWTIPICLAIVNLSVLQVNYLARKRQKGFGKVILYVLRGFSLYIAYISTTVPSAISLYWLTSSCYGLCQNLMLTNSRVKKVLGIPVTDNTRKNPIGHSYKRIKNIVKFFKY